MFSLSVIQPVSNFFFFPWAFVHPKSLSWTSKFHLKKWMYFKAYPDSLPRVFGIPGQLSGLNEHFIPHLNGGAGVVFAMLFCILKYQVSFNPARWESVGDMNSRWLCEGQLKYSGIRVISEELGKHSQWELGVQDWFQSISELGSETWMRAEETEAKRTVMNILSQWFMYLTQNLFVRL